MKNLLLKTTAFCGIMFSFWACQKDISTNKPSSVNSFSEDSYTELSFTVQTPISGAINANIGGYLEALPATYSGHPNKRYPLIIYLHGLGNLGDGSITSLLNLQKGGIAGLIAQKKFPSNFYVNDKTFQFIVLSPQFKQWPLATDVNDMLNYAIKKYRIDTAKVYICGSSMGGGATWDFTIDYGKRAAAIVPIAGASWPTTDKALKIAQSGACVWAFHNIGDSTVPEWYSQNYVSYINSDKPRIPARLTVFPVSGHNAWTTALDPNYTENGQNIYEWMLMRRDINY